MAPIVWDGNPYESALSEAEGSWGRDSVASRKR
jgi:hypothetical protein